MDQNNFLRINHFNNNTQQKIMKDCQTSHLIARQTIIYLDDSIWKRLASQNLQRIVPKQAGYFNNKALQTYVCPNKCKEQRKKTQIQQPRDQLNLKETMLTNSVPAKYLSSNQLALKSNSKASSQNTRSRRETQFSNKYFKTGGKNSTASKINLNTTISQTNIQEKNNKIFFQLPNQRSSQDHTDKVNHDLLEKKIQYQQKQENRRRLDKLKEKARKERQVQLRKKLKQKRGIWFNYEGQMQQNGDIPNKMLYPEVIIQTDIPEGNQITKKINHKIKNQTIDIKDNASKQTKVSNVRMSKQEKLKNQINSFLMKNQYHSHQRIFGHMLDSKEQVSQGVSIFQKQTGFRRQRPLIRGKNCRTLYQFKNHSCLNKFNTYQNKPTLFSNKKSTNANKLASENEEYGEDRTKQISVKKDGQSKKQRKKHLETRSVGSKNKSNSCQKIYRTSNEGIFAFLII